MGNMYEWHCNECGANEEFYCGGGFLSFNDPDVVELSRSGAYGPAMKTLLGNGIPEGWTVFNKNAFYLCPGCGGIINGSVLRIDDRSGSWLEYHAKPEACPNCGEELVFWDDKVPMSENELVARCQGYAEKGCPKCGSKKVSTSFANWD